MVTEWDLPNIQTINGTCVWINLYEMRSPLRPASTVDLQYNLHSDVTFIRIVTRNQD